MSTPPAEAARTERLEGKLLDGRFFVQRQLGAGAFGAVYLAEQRVFNVRLRQVALKLFHGTAITPENAAEVLKDALMLIQLQQEPAQAEITRGLITVYDAGFLHDRPGQAFVAMEYVDGYRAPDGSVLRTLQDLIAYYRPVPVDLALRWMEQILRPLAWMHTLPRPVLHCDLKPDNILASGQDALKIADFGLAQLVFGGAGSSHMVGALAYQAPETLLGMYPTAAADVYAMGLILYEILTGENPFTGFDRGEGNPQEVHVRARQEGVPSLLDCDHPEMKDHPLLAEIVARCLRFKASERYDNAQGLLADIAKYARGAGVTVMPHTAEPARAETPETPDLDRLLAEAQALLAQRRFEAARERCERARALYPRAGRPYRWLAEIHLAQGQWQDAVRVCSEGRRLDPAEPELLDALAQAYTLGRQPAVAAAMARNAADLRQKARR